MLNVLNPALGISWRLFLVAVWCATGVLIPGCTKSGELPSPQKNEISPESDRTGLSLTADLLPPEGALSDAATEDRRPIPFRDVSVLVGVDYHFANGDSPKKLMPAATSGGCGWIDLDHDSFPDLILPQGGSMELAAPEILDRVFRNSRGEHFEDCSEECLIASLDRCYGSGVSVADFDNDGFSDIYIANVGLDVLYRNLGDGTFQDLTQAAGIVNEKWASSVAFGDLENDGDLDIYVCNYVDYDPQNPIPCLDLDGRPTTCHPRNVDEISNRYFENDGDGTFQEVSNQRSLNASGSKSLGVVIADLDRDRDLDVYVANDTEANHLFLNDGQGHFRENAVGAGVAASGQGHLQASMGVGVGDYDQNGLPDLYVTHFIDDSNTMYRNLGNGAFTDSTRECGLHTPCLAYLAFGTVMDDFDADGWQDLFIANGHIDDLRESTGSPWKMSSQILRYNGRRWTDVSSLSGDYFAEKWLGRGVAAADYNRDGGVDLAVVHQNAQLGLLKNEAALGHWLSLTPIGDTSSRTAIGVEITVTQDAQTWTQQLCGGSSYSSAHQPMVYFGVGESNRPVTLSVHWPSGHEFHADHVKLDRHYLLSEKNGLLEP
ncbi:MAG: CRTAC1 family protein [Planctomycetaceae bacterium]